jgi:hypothetical protein
MNMPNVWTVVIFNMQWWHSLFKLWDILLQVGEGAKAEVYTVVIRLAIVPDSHIHGYYCINSALAP